MRSMFFALTVVIATLNTAMAHEPTANCFIEAGKEESLSPLREKIAFGGVDKQKFEMLANGEFPTEEEKALILLWVNLRIDCMKRYEALREIDMHPVARSILEQGNTELVSLTADLYSGKITYGQFAKARAANSAKYVAQSNIVNEQLRQQEQAAARQAALGILQNQRPYQPPQIQFHPMETDKTTTCNMLGSQMVCRTR